jgi:crossover junction endodeoxyribonuclease RusA
MGGITLPWPPKELSPNARVHFQRKASFAKTYREYAYWTAKMDMALAKAVQGIEGEVLVRIDFHPPDARKRDLDNMLASVKSGLDGMADAIEINDSRFALHLYRQDPVPNGKVVVSIAP